MSAVHTLGQSATADRARANRGESHDADTNPSGARGRRWAFWLLSFAVWTLLGLLSFAQNVVDSAYVGRAVNWKPELAARMVDWYTCAIFTPAYFWLVRRFPVDRRRWMRHGAVILGATVLFVVIKYALYVPILARLVPRNARTLQATLADGFIVEVMAFAAVVAVIHAIEFYRGLRERELRASQLEARLARAQLDALKGQLHPHFLFNALNAVSTLMHRDVDAADRMVAQLSDLLRLTLQGGGAQEVALREELDVLERYLGIMQIRFGDRLVVSRTIEPEALDALVPHFILQPLVENAIRHGVARHADAGRIDIAAVREGDALRLTVSDDGPGLALDGDGPREGIGLSNTRARLRQLHGDAHRFALVPREGRGLTVLIEIPFRREASGRAGLAETTEGAWESSAS